MMISRTIWTDNKLSPSDGHLTSYEQSGVQRRKCILTSKVAGCNLTFPETVIEVQGGSPDQQAAIAAATSHPLVFIRMHAHRFPVFLPDTLPALVLYPAAQLYIVAGRYLLVKRRCFYKPLLADDARDVRNNEEEYREMDYAIESHHFPNGRNNGRFTFTIHNLDRASSDVGTRRDSRGDTVGRKYLNNYRSSRKTISTDNNI